MALRGLASGHDKVIRYFTRLRVFVGLAMRCFALCLAVFFVALLEQVPVGFDNKCFSPAVCFSVTSSVTEITLQCGIASRFSM